MTNLDLVTRPHPDAVQMKGLVGERFIASSVNRLHHQEPDHLLWAFHDHCPVGYMLPNRPRAEIRGDWSGEFMGTWLDAAVLSAWNMSDSKLKTKIDGMVADWLSTQQTNGYLGTFDEKDRWESWDIWVQAHNIIGLISYYHYTGEKSRLNAAVRIADRVLWDFGPGKRHLFESGPHGGMASSAFLEPLMWLYSETGDHRYLEFGRWLVDVDWEAPGGPAIISSLMTGRGVAGTANAKGIEMLTNFAGLVEMYRVTGERHFIEPVLIAWEDIVQHHLYITGSASTGEFFQPDFVLRNDGVNMLGETCVSMGWFYLNLKLGRLFGEARFFDMAEQTLYNHLLSAQSPDGRGWAYYVGLRDSKRYRWHTDPECCPSRGVRALAHIPQHIYGLTVNGLMVNLYEPSQARLELLDGVKVNIATEGNYPFDGNIKLKIDPDTPAEFTLKLRLPGWCRSWDLSLNNNHFHIEPDEKGYLTIQRCWSQGDFIELEFKIPPCFVFDKLGNIGRVAIVRGPLVFAADAAYLPGGRTLDDVILKLDKMVPSDRIRIAEKSNHTVHLLVKTMVPAPKKDTGWWREDERYREFEGNQPDEKVEEIELVPFFEAGNLDSANFREGIWPNDEAVRKITYQVWIPFYS